MMPLLEIMVTRVSEERDKTSKTYVNVKYIIHMKAKAENVIKFYLWAFKLSSM